MRLRVVPHMSRPVTSTRLRALSLSEANQLLAAFDPNQGPVRTHKFALALDDQNGATRGVAVAGPPSTPWLDTGCRLEIVRVATDGAAKACTILLRAAAQAGAAIGYRRADIHTYAATVEDEAALRAAGWVPVAPRPGSTGSGPGQRDADQDPSTGAIRWHAAAPTAAGSHP